MEEAIFLAKFSSKVVIVNRRAEFRASKIMLERARATENIEFLTPYVVEEFLAGEDGALDRGAAAQRRRRARQRELAMDGAFIAIGHEPQSELVEGIVDIDENGYVVTEGRSTRTNVPGIFAAGDLVDHTYRQAITAAGSGCQAALDAEWYLRDNPAVPTPARPRGHGRPRRGAVGPCLGGAGASTSARSRRRASWPPRWTQTADVERRARRAPRLRSVIALRALAGVA